MPQFKFTYWHQSTIWSRKQRKTNIHNRTGALRPVWKLPHIKKDKPVDFSQVEKLKTIEKVSKAEKPGKALREYFRSVVMICMCKMQIRCSSTLRKFTEIAELNIVVQEKKRKRFVRKLGCERNLKNGSWYFDFNTLYKLIIDPSSY